MVESAAEELLKESEEQKEAPEAGASTSGAD
jgi:hypothetical protein